MSDSLFQEAQRFLVGGVNSPVRSFRAVGGVPIFMRRGEGAFLYDEAGRPYLDYVGSWGCLILGHAHPAVLEAVRRTAEHGLGFGAPTRLETRLAEMVCGLMPSIERLRMVNSGTEATMSAIRLARGFTGREQIVKFEGCYHGHGDSLLVKAGSGALSLGIPSSAGVPPGLSDNTLCLDFNDAEMCAELFARQGERIAAVIVEPVAGNMNCVPATQTFLSCLRQQCDQYGSVLIFDEVMSGFRVAPGGAQAHYRIRPDLSTLGKILGGGLPVGAFGGRADIMAQLAPEGPVYQAGTLSGNPVAMAAGLATLEQLVAEGFHSGLEEQTRRLLAGCQDAAAAVGIPLCTNQAGSMFGLFFTDAEQVGSYQQVMDCNVKRFGRFFHAMLEQGVYLAPSAFEAGFVSAAHGTAEIDRTIDAMRTVFATL